MGNSREVNCKGIDAAVGGLVWVRRRNGSWWPGRIVGLDELPETCMVSQRLGMPVKLLGRKDASVDWYNLEKSKRVKAFRCGEYDEYIEKAKAKGRSNKKATKYASRKDAILCALELESACSGAWEVCVRMSYSPGAKDENLARQPHSNLDREDYMPSEFTTHLKRRCSQLDNVNELLKKKHRHRPLAEVLESTDKVMFPFASDPGASPNQSSTEGITVSKKSVAPEVTEPKNTSSSAGIHNNSDTQGISLVVNNNVSENTYDAAVDATHSEGCLEIRDNEYSNTLKFPNADISNSSLNMPFGGEQNENEGFSPALVSCGFGKLQCGMLKRQSSHCSQVCSVPLNTEGSHETISGRFATPVNCAIGFSGKVEKRSIGESLPLDERSHLEKVKMIADDAGKWRNGAHCSLSSEKSKTRKSVFGATLKESLTKQSQALSPMRYQGSLSCLQSRFPAYSDYEIALAPVASSSVDPLLFDVDINVRASCHGGRVPLVSLISKLNGKAIVGHPITIDILEDGQSNLLMNGINHRQTVFSSDLYDVPIKCTSSPLIGIADNSVLIDRRDGGVRALQFIPKRKRNNLSCSSSRSPLSRRKLPKMRTWGYLYGKTCELSPIIAGNDRLVEDKKLAAEKAQPIMSCVPVKHIFARIKEALSSSGLPACQIKASTSS